MASVIGSTCGETNTHRTIIVRWTKEAGIELARLITYLEVKEEGGKSRGLPFTDSFLPTIRDCVQPSEPFARGEQHIFQ